MSASAQPGRVVVNLESPLPASLSPGAPTAIYCSGTAWADGGPIAGLEFAIGDDRQPSTAFAMPRWDVPCRRSGFWGVVRLRAPSTAGVIELDAVLALATGDSQRVSLGKIPIRRDHSPPAAARPGDLIAICLGTYNPDPRRFRAQVDSIRAQTDRRWLCVISDDHSSPEHFEEISSAVAEDSRFTISRAPERVGFYRNFERALTLAPSEAALIALCDQDDVWYPEKLSVLRGSLGSATLVYSDQRVVDEHGRVIRETLWSGRRNNCTNLTSMLIANTVTGAASLFRREVAERALPFPDAPGVEFHDHWIALVALASGPLAYVDRPLYDYVQHAAAVLGGVATAPPRARRIPRPRLRDWRSAYFLGYVPARMRALTLLMRCADGLTRGQRTGLERIARSETSPLWLAWLALRPLRMLTGRTETLAGEWDLVRGIIWRHLAATVARLPRWPDRLTLDTRFPDPPLFEHKRMRRWRESLSE